MRWIAAITVAPGGWMALAALALIVGAALAWWAYRDAPVDRRVRHAAMTLRVIAILTLAMCLLEPLYSGTMVKPGANVFVILADNSMGMQVRDRGATESRGDQLQRTVATDSAWFARLAHDFKVRRYQFDTRLTRVDDFSTLTFDGSSSAIGSSLKTIAERYRGRPLAGVLLLSDGNSTDKSDLTASLEGLPPVYPVVIGGEAPASDIAISNVAVSRTSFEDAPVTIRADVRAFGVSGRKVVATLLDPSGQVAEKQTQPVTKSDESLAFHFNLRPKTADLAFYKLLVREQAEIEAQEADPQAQSAEATLANNQRVLVIDRGGGPYRILYVAGRPNWEYKFLRRAIEEDDQIDLVAMIRVARKEPKFDWRGRTGETTNPLFRGFDRTTEETERYDQAVIVRLNTRDAEELRDGFPKTAELLYEYHAVIFDDTEAEFLTFDQMALLQRFVSERGGGFLMLGGQESLGPGKFHRTPVGEMLPVYLDMPPQTDRPQQMRLELTREGWLQPWARLANTEHEERARRALLPPFKSVNRVRSIKPGASVVASVDDDRGESYPALAVQRFGNGRAAAMMVGDLWRWQLTQETINDDLAKAWRQMLRWLVADVPARIELRAEHDRQQSHQPIQLQVRVRDEKFQPMDNVTVAVEVEPLGDESITLTAEPSLAEAGLYEATYVPRATAGYRARAVVNDSEGNVLGESQVGWSVDLAADEFASMVPNRALLQQIAAQTGGEMIEPGDLDRLVASLPNRKAPITQTWTRPLWHLPAVFAFALLCFIAEWGLRRWRGLP